MDITDINNPEFLVSKELADFKISRKILMRVGARLAYQLFRLLFREAKDIPLRLLIHVHVRISSYHRIPSFLRITVS